MASPNGLERARADIAAARLWKARDRLQGLLAHRPADQEVLNLLAQVSFEMGDLPAAGRYWFLTEHDDPRRAQAEAALYERHGRGALELIRALPVKASIEAYPPAVQERLHSLQAEVEQVGFRWVPGASRQAERAPKETRSAAWLGGAVAVLGCGVFLVGLVGTAVLLWRLLTAIF